MRTLYVAAGGGGDAVGALLARRALGDTDDRRPLVSTCAWERLRIDPVPGPRARADFTGLALVNGDPAEVMSGSDTVPPGRSVLPRLARTSGARIFLHDFDGGAVSLRGQLQRLSESIDVDKIVLIDVGGDIVARGPEPSLRSPLADSLTLAAALGTGISTSVVVLGPGADAELPEPDVLRLLEETGATRLGHVTPNDVKALRPVLSWHPTEASTLVAAGAQGMRGAVAMRRGRAPVRVTDRTQEVWVIRDPAVESFPLAQTLQATTTLPEAEEIMRSAAVNEIDFEKKIAKEPTRYRLTSTLPQLVSEMTVVGATHVTTRRLTEAIGPQGLAQVARGFGHDAVVLWSLDYLSNVATKISRKI